MASVNIALDPKDVYLLVGLLAAGADPLADPDPALVPKYRALGDALVQHYILQVRAPAVATELEAARAALFCLSTPLDDRDE